MSGEGRGLSIGRAGDDSVGWNYEGQLEAPPSPRDGHCGAPPILYRSVNGTYRDRQNRDEALEVVALLREFWLDEGPCPTIGVVTFNQPQQELIEDLIQEECEENGELAVRYQEALNCTVSNQDVGFFVRNLENVQGDERDEPTPDERGRYPFPLKLDHYNKLRDPDRQSALILVVLYLPPDPSVWLVHSSEGLIARRCAYWVGLRGAPESLNRTSQTVYVPCGNLFSVEGLRTISTRASRGDLIDHEPKGEP